MLKIKIVCVGNLKEKYMLSFEQEYLKRLSKYAKIEIIEVSEAKILSYNNKNLIDKTLDEEAQNILKNIKDNEYVYLMDLHGKEIDSIEFSKQLVNIQNNSYSTISFIIGGTLGVSDLLKKRANFLLSISPLTFTHQLTRIILLEQIYRCFKIINNENYHH